MLIKVQKGVGFYYEMWESENLQIWALYKVCEKSSVIDCRERNVNEEKRYAILLYGNRVYTHIWFWSSILYQKIQ